MNDRDILRHERLDRVNTFGIENLADLPAGCEAITRFANLTTMLRGQSRLTSIKDYFDFLHLDVSGFRVSRHRAS